MWLLIGYSTIRQRPTRCRNISVSLRGRRKPALITSSWRRGRNSAGRQCASVASSSHCPSRYRRCSCRRHSNCLLPPRRPGVLALPPVRSRPADGVAADDGASSRRRATAVGRRLNQAVHQRQTYLHRTLRLRFTSVTRTTPKFNTNTGLTEISRKLNFAVA